MIGILYFFTAVAVTVTLILKVAVSNYILFLREVVVAQLAERSLTIPEDLGSIPVIGNFY